MIHPYHQLGNPENNNNNNNNKAGAAAAAAAAAAVQSQVKSTWVNRDPSMLRVCRKTSGVTKPDPVSSESRNIPWYGRFRERDCSVHATERKAKRNETGVALRQKLRFLSTG